MCIVDEGTGFTGGIGIADEWDGDARDENEWRDTHFRLRGPAVDGLRAAFLDNWVETDPELYDPEYDHFPVQPSSGVDHGDVRSRRIRDGMERHRHPVPSPAAERREVDPDHDRVLRARASDSSAQLCDASDRGIDVQVLLPGPHADKRFVQLAGQSSYAQLLDHGVAIWCFQPTMLHAKVMTVDGVAACIGSANFNCSLVVTRRGDQRRRLRRGSRQGARRSLR